MARPRTELSAILHAIPEAEDVYFQAPEKVKYPCIIYEVDDEFVARADNGRYADYIRYQITVIDRDPDSLIPGYVSALPLTRLDRRFKADGLYHTVYNTYF